MNTKKIFIGTLAISALFTAGLTVKADDTVAPNVDVASNGDVNLIVPDNADKVITDTENQVKYVVNDAAALDSENGGDDFVVPVTVDSQVTSDTEDTTSGLTTYTVDLAQAEVTNDDSDGVNLGAIVLGGVFGTKASAATTFDSHSSAAGWEKTGGVKFRLAVHWKIIDSYFVNITDVSGGYSIYDSSLHVTDGKVVSQMGFYTQKFQRSTGSQNSWSYNTGFTKMQKAGNRESTTYSAKVWHGSSSWTYKLTNQPF
ncbi:hypothetical protein [Lactococcus kimchii]|uniref:hypothetical protein n=1 Tax=Lactococcus sp. S-13 TaxID=2507158 RepID=UPI001022C504|nr:hypothetical protein [Lactococcus sp. S-13]RZI49181.1 hypothetical protein EQJ87_06860 [Lactococcus sp. S-13]